MHVVMWCVMRISTPCTFTFPTSLHASIPLRPRQPRHWRGWLHPSIQLTTYVSHYFSLLPAFLVTAFCFLLSAFCFLLSMHVAQSKALHNHHLLSVAIPYALLRRHAILLRCLSQSSSFRFSRLHSIFWIYITMLSAFLSGSFLIFLFLAFILGTSFNYFLLFNFFRNRPSLFEPSVMQRLSIWNFIFSSFEILNADFEKIGFFIAWKTI